jgi:hypothetical protein
MFPPQPSPARTDKPSNRRHAAPAGRVRGLLLEIAFALHATRVVGRRGRAAPKKG